MTHSPHLGDVQSPCCPFVSSRLRSQLKVKYLTNKYYTLCRVRSITPLLMEGFSSNLNDTFTSFRGCAEPMFFPQHILPLLPLYNAQWWGYESLTAIVLVQITAMGLDLVIVILLLDVFVVHLNYNVGRSYFKCMSYLYFQSFHQRLLV